MERQTNFAKTTPKTATPAATPAEIEQESQAAPTPVEVTANETVDDIKKDLSGNPYVTIETGSYWSVQCVFPKEDIAVLTRLSKGQKVRIAGRVTSTTMNILLKQCRLVVEPLNQVRTAKQYSRWQNRQKSAAKSKPLTRGVPRVKPRAGEAVRESPA